MRKRIVSYIAGSMSARELSRATGVLRLKTNGTSRFRARPDDLIVIWGSSNLGGINARNARVLNKPDAVNRASNKLLTFQAIGDMGVPYCHNIVTAREWLGMGTKVVVCRTTVTGHSGQGIVLARTAAEVVSAPLYTKYVPKKDEYRVHVFGGRVIDYAMKKRRRDAEVTNEYVRSHANGWVFVRDSVLLPNSVGNMAKRAIQALGLDFGAVDIICDKHSGQPYVLEINTAPGLVGTTLGRYADAIRLY